MLNNIMYANENPVFKIRYFKEDTWLYIKSKYRYIIIHLKEDSCYQLYAFDKGYDFKNNIELKPIETGDELKYICLSVYDEMEDYNFIIRVATDDEIGEVNKLLTI